MGRLYERQGSKCWHMTFMVEGKQHRLATGIPIGTGRWEQRQNKKEAQQILNAELVKVAQGKWVGKPLVEKTIKDLADRYLAEHVPKKKSARSFYRIYTENLRKYFGNDTPLSQVTTASVKKYKLDRLQEGVSLATVNRGLAVLRHMFNLASSDWEWALQSPFVGERRVKLEKENNARTRYLTLDEEARLLEKAPGWLKEIIQFALWTGMRLGEVLNLTWPQVDLTRKVAILSDTKNSEPRTVPIDGAIDVLKKRVRSIQTDLVFYSEAHSRYDVTNIDRAFRRVLKGAKIDDFRFHDLRHTYASRLAQSGVDLSAISRILGHKSLAMTMRYSHHSTASLQGAVETMLKVQEAMRKEAGERSAINAR